MPRAARGTLVRDRLERLCEPLVPVTLVHGAAGFGRSTFVAQWSASLAVRGHLVLRLDPLPERAPGAPTGVVGAVARALDEAQGEPPGPDIPSIPDLAARLRAVGRPVVLVLDSPEPPDEPSLEDLTRLLARCPNLHLVATAADRHPMSALAAAAALDQRFVIAADLAFTCEEVVELARRSGIAEDAGELEPVRAALGGWPSLVRHVLEASAAGWPRVDWSGVTQFFDELELPGALGESGLDDLAAIALTESITSSQWMHEQQRSVLGGKGPFERLRSLEVLGLATKEYCPDTGEPLWTMPRIVAAALVERLRREHPETVSRAYVRLARAFLSEGLLREGLELAVRADSPSLLTEVWGKYGFAPLMGPGRPTAREPLPRLRDDDEGTVHEHARLVLAAVGHDSPRRTRLAVVEAETRLASELEGQREPRRPAAQVAALTTHLLQQAALHSAVPTRAGTILSSRSSTADPSSSYFAAWTRVSVVLGHLLSGDREATFRALHETNAGLRGPGEAAGRAMLLAVEALLHMREGRLKDSAQALALSRDLDADAAGTTALRGLQAITAAHLALLRLDLETVDAEIELAHDYGADHDLLWPVLLEARALAAALAGRPAHGLSLLRSVSHSGQQSPLGRRVLRRCAVELLCASGEVNRAQALLDEEPLGRGHQVAQARVLLVSGAHDEAGMLAARFAWDRSSTAAESTALLVVQAAANEAAGRTDLAERCWEQAREVAGREGALLPYVLLPEPMRARLLASPGRLPDPAASERVAGVALTVPSDVPFVRLTPRERLVLQLLAAHPTMREVASELTVSVNTVKKQTMRIYTKLGVNEREAALQRAQALGLL